MTSKRTTLINLQVTARGFSAKNHKSYLSEALQCLRYTRDPICALRLLAAMQGSVFASRNDQAAALYDVGAWLEVRIADDPTVVSEDLAWELGWLRRFAGINNSNGGAAKEARAERRRRFGEQLERLARRRNDAAKVPQARLPVALHAPPPLSPPMHLPATFPARFANIPNARKARRIARKRAKDGKPVKECWLEVRPIDPQLSPLAIGLKCNLLDTKGLDEVLEAVEPHFYVVEIETREAELVVLALSRTPPRDGANQSEPSIT